MAKIKIPFNNTDYSIDESALASAKDSLKTHLSTVMNGSGGGLEPITWDGVGGDVWEEMSGPVMSFVKVSDRALTVSDFVGATATMGSDTQGETASLPIGEGDVMSFAEYAQMQGGDALSQGAVVALEATSTDSSGSSSTFKMPVIMSVSEVAPEEAGFVMGVGTYFVRFAPNNEGVTTYLQSLTFPSGSTAGNTTITLDGVEYSVDSTKLSTATDGFVAHIGTLTGEGGLEPITWDGNTDGKVTIHPTDTFVFAKISDKVFSVDDYIGSTLTVTDMSPMTVTPDMIMADDTYVSVSGIVISILIPNAVVDGIVFPEVGTYVANMGGRCFISLTFAGGSTGGNTIITINGTEYPVDFAKLSDAIADLHEALGRLQSGV